jgi:hypothetical protein
MGIAGAARADVLSYGTDPSSLTSVTATEVAVGLVPSGATEYLAAAGLTGTFSDIFTFSLPASGTFTSGLNSEQIGLDFGTTPPGSSLIPLPVSVALYQGTGPNLASYTLVASGTGDGPTTFNPVSISLTGGDNFYIVVDGTVSPTTLGGGVGGSFTVSPVPEPASVALMLAGLMLVGSVGVRRQRLAQVRSPS